MRPLLDCRPLAEPRLAPLEDPSLPRHGPLPAGRQAGDVLPHGRGAFTPLGRAGREYVARGGSGGVSRPKKMLPVLGQSPQELEVVREPEAAREEPARAGCTDACCSDVAEKAPAATPTTREADPEAPD